MPGAVFTVYLDLKKVFMVFAAIFQRTEEGQESCPLLTCGVRIIPLAYNALESYTYQTKPPGNFYAAGRFLFLNNY